MRSDILNGDHHPVRYLLADGFCHVLNSDTPFTPETSQFPSHFQSMITDALAVQSSINWVNSLKGYLAKQWGQMAQYDMQSLTRHRQAGEKRMRQIVEALSSHVRRLWLSRNEVLHSPSDSSMESIRSAESAEIRYYHSRPHLLRLGDQHYCTRSLEKLLAGTPATRRRWLRKVKQSSADLTKDGTKQTLITKFFRPAN